MVNPFRTGVHVLATRRSPKECAQSSASRTSRRFLASADRRSVRAKVMAAWSSLPLPRAYEPPAVQVLTPLAPQGLAISLMTYAENYEGIYFGQDPVAAARTFRAFLRSVAVLPINRTIMRRFAQIRGDLRQRGQLIGDPDILIAATALNFGP